MTSVRPISRDLRSVLALCRMRGITLAVRDGHLHAGPVDKIDAGLKTTLRRSRDALVAHLSRPLIESKRP